MSAVVSWRDGRFDRLPVGGKARALAALCRAGFRVPAWVVVLPETAAAVGEAGWEAFVQETPGPWAVRSSAVDEDGVAFSFAGQLESFLDVPRAAVGEKIRAVRDSGFSERILAYRRQAGLSLPPPMPAVIVQQMVAAEWAGVAFSADPVSGRRGVAVVAAVRGLGEALVGGERSGDSFHVDRAGRICQRAGTETGLEDARVLAVADLARRAEQVFGRPQDIEWAVSPEGLFLLQSRPITSLCGVADPDGAWQLWDNSNIAESYSGVTTPLTFSFAREVYEEVYRQFVKILRVPARRVEDARDVFGRMLGLIRGRVYYNMLSWYRVLAMLPGFAVNRGFMEQMMGVRESLPPEVLTGLIAPPRRATLRDYAEIAGTLAGLLGNYILLPRRIAAFSRRLDAALAGDAAALSALRPDELAARYRRLQNDLLTRWDAPLINDFFAMISFGVSRRLVHAWCNDPDGTLQNDLIVCQGGIISAEPAQRMRRLAELARGSEELRRLLGSAAPSTVTSRLREWPEFSAAYAAYLEKFGDRCLEELKLESATLHDDPTLLLRSIARLAERPAVAGVDGEAVSRAAQARVGEALAGKHFKRLVFDFVVGQTRRRVRDRENLRFERTRVFGRVRRIFVELGLRFHALGLLDEPRDIFFLQTEEALGLVEGTAVTADVGRLARQRREEFAAYRDHPPAGRFETRGMVYVGHDFAEKPGTSSAPAGDERKGLGCCPGAVRGRVRVVRDPRGAEIQPGEILVAARTDPGWILLFPAAAGLLVEQGSLLSHSAIVAREMGIPAVVSLPGLTDWLETGDEVALDGATGRVVRLGKDPAHAE